jgi:hypothetical protein
MVTVVESVKLTNSSMGKYIGIGLGGVLGLSHFWMIGLLANKEAGLPKFNLPTSPYSQYTIDASKDGYSITHRMNDPRVMEMKKEVVIPGRKGIFGSTENRTVVEYEQYTMEGKQHLMGPGIFQDKSKLPSDGKLTEEQIACLKKAGAGQGRSSHWSRSRIYLRGSFCLYHSYHWVGCLCLEYYFRC